MKLSEIKLWKFNVVDITIILLVIIFAGIFGISYIKSNDDGVVAVGNNSASTKFAYTISVEGLSKTSAEMFKIGDDIYDKVSNTYIGKIVELEITDAKGVLEKENGEAILTNVPGKIDVKLKIETEGNIKNGEYLANGLIRIMVGNFKEIKTKYVMCFGTVSSIERNKAEA